MDTRVKTDNETIAEFMGYECVRIGYYGTDDETPWQVKNRRWLDKAEIYEQYNNSVGEYYANVKGNEIIPVEDVDYANSWNDLMPVINKITPLAKQVGQQAWFDVGYSLTEANIEGVYKAVLEFIRWYNSQKQ